MKEKRKMSQKTKLLRLEKSMCRKMYYFKMLAFLVIEIKLLKTNLAKIPTVPGMNKSYQCQSVTMKPYHTKYKYESLIIM